MAITAEEYRARKATGLCLWGACPAGAASAGYCEIHHPRILELRRRYQRKKYESRKCSGACIRCGEPATETTYCDGCYSKKRARDERYNAKPRSRTIKTASNRRWIKARVDIGLCIRCNEPSSSKLLCEAHKMALVADSRSRRPVARRISLCRTCRKPGHNAASCQQRPLDMVPLEEYATARVGSFNDTAPSD